MDGSVTFPILVRLHDQVGSTSFLRLQAVAPNGDNVRRWQEPFVLGGCHDCGSSTSITVDTSSWPTGRHELRFTANVPDEQPDKDGAQRMLQSTGIQLCVRSCTPSYRDPVDFLEARGWYDDVPDLAHGYQSPRLTSPLSSVRSGGTITVRLNRGAEAAEESTVFTGVYIDPDMHAGRAGIVVMERADSYIGSVTLPVLPSGPHRLVMIASDGQNAGVLSIPFTVP